MFKQIKNILSLQLVRNTLKLSSSNVITMLLPLIVTPILSRLYTPTDYGDWGVFVSVVYTIQSFLFLSYENTIVKTDNEKEIPSLVVLCLIVGSLVLLLTHITFIGGKALGISFFKNFPSLSLLLFLLIIIIVSTILKSVSNRNKIYGPLAVSGIVDGLSQAGLRLLFGVFPIVAYGLIVGNVIAQLLAAIFLLIYTWRYLINLDYSSVKLNRLWGLVRKYKKFPLFDAPARIVEIGMGSLPIIILSYYWDKSQLGCYSMIVTFLLLPLSVIGSSMGNVYYKELSENQHSFEAMQDSTIKASKICFWLSILPLLFLTLGGDKLLVLFLGKNWGDAGHMALCMSLYSMPVIMSEPLLPIFRIVEKQEIRFGINFTNFVFAIGSLIVVPIFSNNIYHTILVYSIIHTSFRFYLYNKELSMFSLSPSNITKLFTPIVVLSYVMTFGRIIIESIL